MFKEGASKAWGLLNTNFISNAVPMAIGSFFTYRFTETYREEELKKLSEKNKELVANNNILQEQVNDLKVSNQRLVSGYTLMNGEYTQCEQRLTRAYINSSMSWCFWRPPINDSISATATNLLNNGTEIESSSSDSPKVK